MNTMPPKRRTAKRKAAYSELLQKLIDGEHIEPSAEGREELIGIAYFGWAEYPELPREIFNRAFRLVCAWDGD
jgi:hypothetical protein